MRFIDTNIFIYVATDHPLYGGTSKTILERVESGEEAATSTLVLCEVAWVLEAMGRQSDIKETLEKILSYPSMEIAVFESDDLIVGSNLMASHRVDFNDAVNLAIMERLGIDEIYSNDEKHIGKLGFIKTVFQ